MDMVWRSERRRMAGGEAMVGELRREFAGASSMTDWLLVRKNRRIRSENFALLLYDAGGRDRVGHDVDGRYCFSVRVVHRLEL